MPRIPRNKFTFKSGFTLFEMLISVAIITIVSGVVFFNHSKFKTDTEITNIAYRMALSVREAQVYGISVKQFNPTGGGTFEVPYGLHFNKRTIDAFILFADGDGDGLYTVPPGEGDMDCNIAPGSECVEKVSIGRGNKIKGWCGILWSDPDVRPCFYQDGNDVDHFLDIKFKRPNPDAIFGIYESIYSPGGAIGQSCGISACTGWAICLVSPDGRKQKQVVVYETGQIAVENVDSEDGCNSIN